MTDNIIAEQMEKIKTGISNALVLLSRIDNWPFGFRVELLGTNNEMSFAKMSLF